MPRSRLTFTPRSDGQSYDFEGPTRFDKLFSGMVCEVPTWRKAGDGADILRDAGRGCEDIGIDDAPDGD